MRRQQQKAIWLVSVVTQTTIEQQNMQPERTSRLKVQRGMEIASELYVDSSITFRIGRPIGTLKPLGIPSLV